jgi:hypothetical protein
VDLLPLLVKNRELGLDLIVTMDEATIGIELMPPPSEAAAQDAVLPILPEGFVRPESPIILDADLLSSERINDLVYDTRLMEVKVVRDPLYLTPVKSFGAQLGSPNALSGVDPPKQFNKSAVFVELNRYRIDWRYHWRTGDHRSEDDNNNNIARECLLADDAPDKGVFEGMVQMKSSAYLQIL